MESERRREWGMGNEGKRKLENGKWVMPNGRGNEKWEARNGDDEWGMMNINVYRVLGAIKCILPSQFRLPHRIEPTLDRHQYKQTTA